MDIIAYGIVSEINPAPLKSTKGRSSYHKVEFWEVLQSPNELPRSRDCGVSVTRIISH